MVGDRRSNVFVGGAGNDTFVGNGGADVLYGGTGDDVFVLKAGNVKALLGFVVVFLVFAVITHIVLYLMFNHYRTIFRGHTNEPLTAIERPAGADVPVEPRLQPFASKDAKGDAVPPTAATPGGHTGPPRPPIHPCGSRPRIAIALSQRERGGVAAGGVG